MFKNLTIYTKVLQTMKTGSTNHHTAISSTQQVSRHDEGSIRHPFIVAYRPFWGMLLFWGILHGGICCVFLPFGWKTCIYQRIVGSLF